MLFDFLLGELSMVGQGHVCIAVAHNLRVRTNHDQIETQMHTTRMQGRLVIRLRYTYTHAHNPHARTGGNQIITHTHTQHTCRECDG